MAWKKENIIQWLVSKGCAIDKPLITFELMKKVNEIRPQHDKYVIDEEVENSNRMILRLAPYHCELTPIKLA